MSSGVQLEKATSRGAAMSHPKTGKQLPMDLLDEYWFFNNTLNPRKVSPRPPKAPQSNRIDNSSAAGNVPHSPSSVPPPHAHPSDTSNKKGDDVDEVLPVPVPMMRAPSMPSPHSNGFDDADHKETQLHSNTKPKGPKMRNSSSTLECHHSWHSAFEVTQSFKVFLFIVLQLTIVSL
jgi:hypothetical protein